MNTLDEVPVVLHMLDDIEQSDGSETSWVETGIFKRCGDHDVEPPRPVSVDRAAPPWLKHCYLTAIIGQALGNKTVACPYIQQQPPIRMVSHHRGDAVVAMLEPERMLLQSETIVVPPFRVRHRITLASHIDP